MSQVWKKVLLYFGLMEDEEFDRRQFEDEDVVEERPERHNVRKLERREVGRPVVRSVPSNPQRVHVIEPRSFNDAQEIADRFRVEIPVIMNLQAVESELAKRMIAFASGLTYGLGGGLQRVAEKVFLLIPSNVEVSPEERRRLQEKGFFFNQL